MKTISISTARRILNNLYEEVGGVNAVAVALGCSTSHAYYMKKHGITRSFTSAFIELTGLSIEQLNLINKALDAPSVKNKKPWMKNMEKKKFSKRGNTRLNLTIDKKGYEKLWAMKDLYGCSVSQITNAALEVYADLMPKNPKESRLKSKISKMFKTNGYLNYKAIWVMITLLAKKEPYGRVEDSWGGFYTGNDVSNIELKEELAKYVTSCIELEELEAKAS